MHENTNGSIRIHSRRQVRSEGLLGDYCKQYKLRLGDPIIHGMRRDYKEYFETYGWMPDVFCEVFRRDSNLVIAMGTTDVHEAQQRFQNRFKPKKMYCPKYIHVYESIKMAHPSFSWTIDYEECAVVFSNYPCSDDGSESPSLYDLLVRSMHLTASQDHHAKASRKRNPAPRRRMASCY